MAVDINSLAVLNVLLNVQTLLVTVDFVVTFVPCYPVRLLFDLTCYFIAV